MSDQHETVEADAVERLRDQRRLPRRRGVRRAARTVAPAVAGTIDQHHPARLREPIAEAEPQIAQIAAGAVNQHHRPERVGHVGAWSIARRRKIEHVKPAAGDVDEPAGRRMGRLDAAPRDRGDEKAEPNQGADAEDCNTEHVFHCCTGARACRRVALPRLRSTDIARMSRCQWGSNRAVSRVCKAKRAHL